MRRIIYRIGRKAGLRFHAHAARHRYAVKLKQQHGDVDLEDIRRMLGHESIDTTMGYFRTFGQRESIEAVRKAGPEFFLSGCDPRPGRDDQTIFWAHPDVFSAVPGVPA